MDRRPNIWFALGCISAAIGVAAGAFGAHGLKNILSPAMLSTFETAVRYQLYHSFALIAVSWAAATWKSSHFLLAGWCFLFGIVLFSGSLFALTLTGLWWFGAITPVGGVAFIAGWVLLALGAFQRNT